MDLVIDANILFSVLIKSAKTEELLMNEDLHAFAPEFLFIEFEKYSELLIKKTGRDHDSFQRILTILKRKIKTIPNEETSKFIEEAKKICPDPNDIDYFALAMKLDCSIWSNDKKLKEQNQIKIYSTEEISKIFY